MSRTARAGTARSSGKARRWCARALSTEDRVVLGAGGHRRRARRGALPAETDWREIVGLYDLLLRITPSPIVALNRSVAVAMRDGPEAGLAQLDQLLAEGALDEYQLAHAARADFCRRLGRNPEARDAYQRAIKLTAQGPARRFLERRLRGAARLRSELSGIQPAPYAPAEVFSQRAVENSVARSTNSQPKEIRVKYLCLVYLSPEHWSSVPDEACMACGNELRASGHLITGTPLHPVHTATTVRVRNGRCGHRWSLRGNQGALAGFYLIEARDLNEAIQLASKIPPAKFGSIEIRPTRELQVGTQQPPRRPRHNHLTKEVVMHSEIYVNLPVKDLKRSVKFLHEARLHVQPQFTDDNGTCMILGDKLYVMLLTEKFFTSFTTKTITDTSKTTEVLTCVACRAAACGYLVAKARAAGGKVLRKAQDHGFMYAHGYEDLDGHTWELIHLTGDPPPQWSDPCAT